MEIRQALASDLPYVYDICLKTGNHGADATALFGDPYLLGQLFAAPYLVHDLHWCWVATSEGRPVGYLVATPDSRTFAEWFDREWLPGLRGLYPADGKPGVSEFEDRVRARLDEPKEVQELSAQYPAHLHIDFLPEAQGQGLGKKLMERFFAQCRAEGVAGVHLGVSRVNEAAPGFYRKLGFDTLEDADWGYVFGKAF